MYALPFSNLHDTLFVQGRCASGFYEYGASCYTIVSRLESRVAEFREDDVSTVCRKTVLQSNCNDTTEGTGECPILMSPKDLYHAAFQRSLVEKFGDGFDSAWVGLKGDKHSVYVSLIA